MAFDSGSSKKAVEKKKLSVQVANHDIWLDGEQKEEYLKTDFMGHFEEDSYLRTDKNSFFIRDGCLTGSHFVFW